MENEYLDKDNIEISDLNGVSESSDYTKNDKNAFLSIPLIWARLCIGCGSIFDMRKSRYYQERKMQFCCKKCYDQFTIIPRELPEPELSNKQIIMFNDRLKRERFKLTAQMRFDILKRDQFRCVYCGKTPSEDKVLLEIDHLIPIIQEGLTINENLVTCCRECNSGKSDNMMSQDLVDEIYRRINDNSKS